MATTGTPTARRAALTSRWDRVGTWRIHARVSAVAPHQSGPPIVLVHGLGVSSRYLVPTGELLAPHYPVYAPDLPGFGLSEKPRRALTIPALAEALADWLTALDLGPAALLGNSMGCQIIVALAVHRPERVRCLVLDSPTMDRAARTVLRQVWRVVRDAPLETGSERLIVVGDYLRAGLPRVWRTLRSALADPLEESLPLVRVPALVVRGSRDPIVSRRWAQDVARLLPEGRYAEIPGAPHAANYSTPHALVRLVLPFLEGVRPGELLSEPWSARE